MASAQSITQTVMGKLCIRFHSLSKIIFHDEDGNYRRCLSCGRRVSFTHYDNKPDTQQSPVRMRMWGQNPHIIGLGRGVECNDYSGVPSETRTSADGPSENETY